MRENLIFEEKESMYSGYYYDYVLENTELQLPYSAEERLCIIKNNLKLASSFQLLKLENLLR